MKWVGNYLNYFQIVLSLQNHNHRLRRIPAKLLNFPRGLWKIVILFQTDRAHCMNKKPLKRFKFTNQRIFMIFMWKLSMLVMARGISSTTTKSTWRAWVKKTIITVLSEDQIRDRLIFRKNYRRVSRNKNFIEKQK